MQFGPEPLFENISAKFGNGHRYGLIGANGCGKSTLLSILGMLDSPSSGAYLFDGTDIANYSEKQLAQLRKTKLGFLFQKNLFFVRPFRAYKNRSAAKYRSWC